MISTQEALQRLREGNLRFADDRAESQVVADQARRKELLAGQHPFAIILGCADSRAPAELIFDQGLGDLFVIRVAGNIVAPSQLGSVEFAARYFGTRLVVVLGHSGCGAVRATLDELKQPSDERSPNLQDIVRRIQPAVEPLLGACEPADPQALMQQAVQANIRASVDQLQHGSQILEDLVQNDGLAIVGAEYSLETGLVEFFDDSTGSH